MSLCPRMTTDMRDLALVDMTHAVTAPLCD